MKSVLINFKEGENNYTKQVPINSIIKLDSSFVDIAKYINEVDIGVLIQIRHHQTITILNLTGVTPYVLLHFDDALQYKGASYSIESGTGSFTVQTQYKNILFVRIPHNLKLNKIINLNF